MEKNSIAKLKNKGLRSDIYALYLAAKDPRTPTSAKALAVLAVIYTLIPVDIAPDFIPILGWLDDLIILPLGIWLAASFVPKEVLEEAKNKAGATAASLKRLFWLGLGLILLVWVCLILLLVLLIRSLLHY